MWALILGFTLSAIIQAVVSKSEMVRLMPDNTTGLIARACGLGAASSSCSYPPVAIAQSIVPCCNYRHLAISSLKLLSQSCFTSTFVGITPALKKVSATFC
ncbi:permease [Nostoc sp.]|uniref:permease n=1 Tax=Nostoc sp. TaxID=1180 RepID=UPI003FA560E8